MEADILVNESISIWISSSDNLSFVIAINPSVGKAIIGLPRCQVDLKMLAEDLLDGRVNYLLHIWLTSTEAHDTGKKLLAIANGVW
jgi:hypothetical protein